MTESDSGEWVLSTSECLQLLRQAPVGRLAVVVDGRPEIFPVNHVIDHGTIVFRTAVGTKLGAALDRPVAYEVDGYDRESETAWSVVVKGTATESSRLHEVLDSTRLPLFPWHDSPKHHIVRIDAVEMSGRRFTVTPEARATAAGD
jgi:nitroimidazol reductase NimA-like FMN-containing flavoprotein (pyridoxamine 5'-phosphate oxidase superfamily)